MTSFEIGVNLKATSLVDSLSEQKDLKKSVRFSCKKDTLFKSKIRIRCSKFNLKIMPKHLLIVWPITYLIPQLLTWAIAHI